MIAIALSMLIPRVVGFKLTGEIKGDRLEGTYESTTAEGPATGSWSVTRAAAGS